jgi:DtxR family Mn-dependent transcriptional regulator
VHEEAERLEHFISERFEDRVAAILGDPEIDPHGHIIPQKYGAPAPREEVPLVRWPLDTPARISSVSDRSPEALRDLQRLGLLPGTDLTVEQRNTASALAIRVKGRQEPIRVSPDLAGCISVTAAPPARD